MTSPRTKCTYVRKPETPVKGVSTKGGGTLVKPRPLINARSIFLERMRTLLISSP